MPDIWDGVFCASCCCLQRRTQESCQTSKMQLFAKIVKNEKAFTIFVKSSIFHVWQGSGYASELASTVRGVSFLN